MNPEQLLELDECSSRGSAVTPATALAMLRAGPEQLPDLWAAASRMRYRFFGNGVRLCSILNARGGACTEDCAFCAQSAHHKTTAAVYDLRTQQEMTAAYTRASALPIRHFGIVTSGGALDAEGVSRVCRAVRARRIDGVSWCASLGGVSRDELLELKAAGVRRFHHNLETAESYFPSVCTTHAYSGRLETIRAVKQAGLEVCSGGILGMGESLAQRVEFALTLAREGVDSIPLNFLIPIPGTPLAGAAPMTPLDILRSVAMFRMTNPRAEIRVCAGRIHLRDLQSMIFQAGATGMMIGPLLTVAGRSVEEDLQMLRDLEVDCAR